MKHVLLPKLFSPYYCKDLLRVGKDNDGGYLINTLDILKSDKLIAFGIGSDSSFEEQFISIKKVAIEAYDASASCTTNFTVYKEDVTSTNIGRILDKNTNVFLKCDIDGGEYGILDELILNSSIFTGAVFEFHNIASPTEFNMLTNFIAKFELRLVHVHVNNYTYIITDNGYIPTVLELTFSSSRDNTKLTTVELPNCLDMPNNPDEEDFTIRFGV
jgi:hypothetical protein